MARDRSGVGNLSANRLRLREVWECSLDVGNSFQNRQVEVRFHPRPPIEIFSPSSTMSSSDSFAPGRIVFQTLAENSARLSSLVALVDRVAQRLQILMLIRLHRLEVGAPYGFADRESGLRRES